MKCQRLRKHSGYYCIIILDRVLQILYVPGWLQHHYVAEDDHEVEFESESCFVSPKCWDCR